MFAFFLTAFTRWITRREEFVTDMYHYFHFCSFSLHETLLLAWKNLLHLHYMAEAFAGLKRSLSRSAFLKHTEKAIHLCRHRAIAMKIITFHDASPHDATKNSFSSISHCSREHVKCVPWGNEQRPSPDKEMSNDTDWNSSCSPLITNRLSRSRLQMLTKLNVSLNISQLSGENLENVEWKMRFELENLCWVWDTGVIWMSRCDVTFHFSSLWFTFWYLHLTFDLSTGNVHTTLSLFNTPLTRSIYLQTTPNKFLPHVPESSLIYAESVREFRPTLRCKTIWFHFQVAIFLEKHFSLLSKKTLLKLWKSVSLCFSLFSFFFETCWNSKPAWQKCVVEH